MNYCEKMKIANADFWLYMRIIGIRGKKLRHIEKLFNDAMQRNAGYAFSEGFKCGMNVYKKGENNAGR